VRPAVRGFAAKHGAAKYGGGVRFLFFGSASIARPEKPGKLRRGRGQRSDIQSLVAECARCAFKRQAPDDRASRNRWPQSAAW